MTQLRRADADLHDENGEHISTPPTADGHELELYARRLIRHMEEHRVADAHQRIAGQDNRKGVAMSDRTHVSVNIYALAPEHHQAALDLLDEYGIGLEFADDPYKEPTGVVRLGAGHYADDEIPLGYADELAAKLVNLGATFEVTEDPKYEYDGQWLAYDPSLGMTSYFACGANGEGTQHVSSFELDAILDDDTTDDDKLARIATLTGKPVRERFNALRVAADAADEINS